MPYLGGYLILLSIAFFLIFTYFFLQRRKTEQPPKYLCRFSITLCLLLTLIQVVLGVIIPLHANDYHTSQQQLSCTNIVK